MWFIDCCCGGTGWTLMSLVGGVEAWFGGPVCCMPLSVWAWFPGWLDCCCGTYGCVGTWKSVPATKSKNNKYDIIFINYYRKNIILNSDINFLLDEFVAYDRYKSSFWSLIIFIYSATSQKTNKFNSIMLKQIIVTVYAKNKY